MNRAESEGFEVRRFAAPHELDGIRRFWSAPLCGAFGGEAGLND